MSGFGNFGSEPSAVAGRRSGLRAALSSSAGLAAFWLAVSLANNAQGAGFYLQEQEARGIGRANAGSAAVADDPSTVFWNPAGMTHLDSAAADISAVLLLPEIHFSDRGTTATTPGSGGAPVPVTGGNGGNPFGPSPVPNVHVAYPLLDKQLWIGLGVTAPFGLKPEYNDSWFGRYESTETSLQVINVGPAVAYKVNNMLSIGGGIDIQYSDAKLKSRIPDPLNPGGPTAATDARFRADGDAFAVGFNAGVTVTPAEGTRLGLHYRSAVTHELEGDVTIGGLTGPLAGANGRSSMKADLKLPDIVGFGIAQKVTPELTLLGQVNYFNWSRYEAVRFRFDDGSPDLVSTQNYKDSWSFAIGAEYQLNDKWTVRGGFQYDQTPSSDATWFSSRVADADRYYVAVGATYRFSDMLSVDVGYAHAFMDQARIDRTDTFFGGTPVASSVTTRGKSEGGFDILGAKAVLRF